MGVTASLLLILRPSFMARINRVANRWVSTRHLDQALEHSVSIEQWCYRQHRMLGVLVGLGAGYMFLYFGVLFEKSAVMPHLVGYLPARVSPLLLEWLLDALVLSALTGAVVAFYVGLLLFMRPSLLRGQEEGANQWLSTRRAIRPLEVPRDTLDKFVAQHASRVGWLLLLSSLGLLLLVSRALVF